MLITCYENDIVISLHGLISKYFYKMKKILALLVTITFGVFSYAQEITGVVLDQNGIPLPGVNIQALTTKTFTATDFDGNFTITAKAGEDLEFTMVGMKTTVQKATKEKMKVVMQEEVNALDEVVVIGYGKQKKADLTGAITSLDSETISRTPASNVTSSLQGKIAGITVTNSGAPGNGADIKLRGVSSFEGNNNPLYVVDGMYYSNIDFLDPSSIKSMSILKDASSTAIFGVKAAGGVIVIETKSGTFSNKQELNYQGYTGVQVPQNILKMANAEQFVTMAYESGSQPDIDHVLEAMQRYGRSRVNPNIPDVNTDWYKETIHPAIITSHNLGFDGGNENTSYAFGINYFDQGGLLTLAENKYQRLNLNARVDVKLHDRVKAGTNLMFSNATQFYAEDGVWNQIYYAVPILPVYDETNTVASPTLYANAKDLGYRSAQNPFPILEFNNNRYKKRSLNANFYVDVAVFKDVLNFKTSYNAAYKPETQRKVVLPYTLGTTVEQSSSLAVNEKLWFDQILDNILTYANNFGNHNVVLMGGMSFRDESYHVTTSWGPEIGDPYNSDGWYINNTLESERKTSNDLDRYYAVSYFGRLQYNYHDKYLLNLSYRAEGNSKYTKKPWGYFPGVGIGWVVSQENFFENVKFVDFLKLRASWGKNGNDKIGASSGTNTVSYGVVGIGDSQYDIATVTSTYADLVWELIEEKNFGLTAKFFENRLTLDVDYFDRETQNAVIPVYQPLASVTINQNAGVLGNSGLEVALQWNNTINDNLTYNFGLNFASLQNEVLDLYGQKYLDIGSDEFRQRHIVGQPVGAFFGYENNGVYQNWDEVRADPIAIANNLEPGDFNGI